MFNTNFVFSSGKLTITLDGGAGSSGKGKLGSFLCEHANNWQFACNTFTPQAAHWVKLDDGRKYCYQTFNSCAYLTDRYEKLYIAPGATIDLDSFSRELAENGIPRNKIGISPVTAVLQAIDTNYERGACDFFGNALSSAEIGGPLAATGSTAKGCGANRARRVMRHKSAKYARDCPELRDLVCDVPREIMGRLDSGQAGLLEIAQGFQLSYLLPDFFPHTTSRNCTVAAGLDDLMVPPYYAGNVILNFRTYPIRINNNKYVDKNSNEHLDWKQVTERVGNQTPSKDQCEAAGISFVKGNSGPPNSDQRELTWADVTNASRSPDPLMEMTTMTGLPRRVFTFSRANVADAILHNRSCGQVYLSLNFANYLDCRFKSHRDRSVGGHPVLSELDRWIEENLGEYRRMLRFIGTGPMTDDMIQLD